MYRLMLSLAIALFFSGCSTVPEQRKIIISTTTFHGADHSKRGTIAVKPLDKTQENSLEFKAVSDYLINSLGLIGYTPANDVPNYVAFISYGIDNGRTSSASMPIYGQTAGGMSFTTGTINIGSRVGMYSGTTTRMPTFGQIGVIPLDFTSFKRVVFIDIYRMDKNQEAVKVFEIKANSVGSCGNINSVLPLMIDAIFTNVPGENGKSRNVEIPWNGTC